MQRKIKTFNHGAKLNAVNYTIMPYAVKMFVALFSAQIELLTKQGHIYKCPLIKRPNLGACPVHVNV